MLLKFIGFVIGEFILYVIYSTIFYFVLPIVGFTPTFTESAALVLLISTAAWL